MFKYIKYEFALDLLFYLINRTSPVTFENFKVIEIIYMQRTLYDQLVQPVVYYFCMNSEVDHNTNILVN